MPIYEYRCTSCQHRFEKLVRGEAQPSCPRCDSAALHRLVSGFAVAAGAQAVTRMSASAPGPAPSPCGTCGDARGPGACALDD
jgi:putative FmdB family regulatory protein